VKLLVVGPICSGKTTVARHLRSGSAAVVDLDDELVRLNGGVYPDIETRKTVIAPQALANACAMAEVILLHSTLAPSDVLKLRAAGFTTALLKVSEVELRPRYKSRLDAEAWTNEAWFDDNQALIDLLRRQRLFDHIIDGERDPATIGADLMRLSPRQVRCATTWPSRRRVGLCVLRTTVGH
jgi:hypothetical protein